MTDSDNGGDYLSDGAEEIEEANMIEAQSEISIEKDSISLGEEEGSLSSPNNSRPSSINAGRKSGTTDELVAGAEAISSDEGSDVEDGQFPQSSSNSPKSLKEPPAKKQKTEPRDDLEDGEIETDSEEEEQEQTPQQQHYTSQPKPLITPPFRMNNNRQFNNNRPKIGFPRQFGHQQNHQNQDSNKRKRPEDCGVCKFYLRGNCTWNDKCKYNHPLGGQRTHWLAELGLPDPEIGYNPNRPRKSDTTKSSSPPDKRSPRNHHRSKRQNGEKSEPKKSPRASPISSDSSRSPSPKRIRQSPTAVSVSSDSCPPSPEGNRRIRSSSSEGSRSRSRSPFASKNVDTTLGALLRKRRLESQSKPSQESSSFLPGNISDSDEDEILPAPKNRVEAVRRFFDRDPNQMPAVYNLQTTKNLSQPISPAMESISSDEEERDADEVFKSSPTRLGSESPILTKI